MLADTQRRTGGHGWASTARVVAKEEPEGPKAEQQSHRLVLFNSDHGKTS